MSDFAGFVMNGAKWTEHLDHCDRCRLAVGLGFAAPVLAALCRNGAQLAIRVLGGRPRAGMARKRVRA